MITLYASIVILLISVALLSATIYSKNRQRNIVCCNDKEYDFWKSTSCNLIAKFASEVNRLEDEKRMLEKTHKSPYNPSIKVKRVKW